MTRLLLPIILTVALSACSVGNRPSGRVTDGGVSSADGGGGGNGGGMGGPGRDCVESPENTPETCSDGIDNNCNFQWDCSDVSCSGVGACPICGLVDTPLGSPLALPDGVGGDECARDADCPGDQTCFTIDGILGPTQECRASYRSTLDFVGFGGATFDAITDLTSVCVVMEHSWIRDVEIALEAPNGARIRLNEFLGQEGGEIYLGQADDCDSASSPTPGTGARYCWTPTATNQAMLEYANAGGRMDSAPDCSGFGDADMMPPGDYQASDDWSGLLGTPLNGEWTLSVTDLWGSDNGYIFEWSIQFDATTVEDCSAPLI